MNDVIKDKEATAENIPLSLRELIALDGFRGVDPERIFGVKFEEANNPLPPLAQSFSGVGSALRGCPLDSWARHGMHHNRRPEFSSFNALTAGLSREEKARAVAILQQYLKDIMKRSDDFNNEYSIFEGETLQRAHLWVRDMMNGVDEDTKNACADFGLPGFNRKLAEAVAVNTTVGNQAGSESVESVRVKTEGGLGLLLKNLFGRWK